MAIEYEARKIGKYGYVISRSRWTDYGLKLERVWTLVSQYSLNRLVDVLESDKYNNIMYLANTGF